jgi:hypothetical protein
MFQLLRLGLWTIFSYLLCVVCSRDPTLFFCMWNLVFLAPFVEDCFVPLDCFGTLVKNPLTKNIRICFCVYHMGSWNRTEVGLALYHPSYQSFGTHLEVRNCKSSEFSPTQDRLGLLGVLVSVWILRCLWISVKKPVGILIRIALNL